MQINPFGFPLGAGMPAVTPMSGPGLGFAAALGIALDGMPQRPAIGSPQAFAPPEAAAQADIAALPLAATNPAAGTLPGLQQPATLSQLMTTAAKLPALDVQPEPVAPAADGGVAEPAPALSGAQPLNSLGAPAAAAASAEIATPIPQGEAEPRPVPTPAPANPVAAAPEQAPAPGIPTQAPAPAVGTMAARDTAPHGDGPARASAEVKLVARKPAAFEQAADEPARLEPTAAAAAVPPELLNAGVAQMPVQQQLAAQPAPAKEVGTGKQGVGGPKAKAMPSAAGDVATQPASSVSQPDFERALAAQGNAGEGTAHADSQPQQHLKPGIGQSDIPAPALQPAHAATVPGSEAARATATEPVIEARRGHLGQSLGVEVARSVKLGEEELRIRLNPVELGRIEVKLAFDESGTLQATVRAESQAALDLLRQDAPELARTLDQAGIRADTQSFRFESRTDTGPGTGQGQNQQRGGQPQQQHARHDDLEPAPEYRTVRGDGRVDLFA